MTARRGRGEGSIYHDDERDRWNGVLDVTEPGTRKRVRRKVSAPTNAARLAEVPEGTRRQSRSMTTAQARQLLASDLTVWWRAYFSLALYCGLRPGEPGTSTRT